MIDPVRELKVRAELLHHAVRASEAAAIERLRALAELRRADDDALRAAAPGIQRKHCLVAVAREAGFDSWDHARRVLEGDPSEVDFGTILCSKLGSAGFLNHWFATYEEARAVHAGMTDDAARGYLLAYKRHFFIATREFIETLGLDPDDPDWEAMGWDWARPRNREARRRLYGKLVSHR